MRFELTHRYRHYPLKVACLPISPSAHFVKEKKSETYSFRLECLSVSERRDSNPRPRPWQGRALPTELLSQFVFGK